MSVGTGIDLNKKIILLAILCTVVLAQEKTIAVLPFDAAGISSEEASILSDRLSSEIYKTGTFIVVERSKMEEVLNEQGFQQSGCVSSECAVEVGAMLGVGSMVVGSVGKFGSLYTVSVRLVDVGSGEVKAQVSRDVSGSIETLLLKTMTEVAAELSGKKIKEEPIAVPEKKIIKPYIDITSNPSSALVLLNEDTLGLTPYRERFSPGTYVFTLVKPGYKPNQVRVVHNYNNRKIQTVNLSKPSGKIGLRFEKSPLSPIDEIKSRTVLIDGRNFGLSTAWQHTGNWTATLESPSFDVGTHEIEIKKYGYTDYKTSVNVVDGQTTLVNVSNQRIMVPVNISLTPTKQELLINGEAVNVKGLTLPYGEYLVQSSASKFEGFKTTLFINDNIPKTLPINLKPKSKLKAMRLSAIIPGGGQFYSENENKGTVFAGVAGLLLFLTYDSYTEHDWQNSFIDSYKQDYNNANTTSEIETTWNIYDSQVNKVNDLNTQLVIYGVTLASVWIANIIDSYLFSGLPDD